MLTKDFQSSKSSNNVGSKVTIASFPDFSLTMLTGDNNILNKAGDAKDITGVTRIQEEIKLAWNGVQIEGIPNGWTNENKRKALEDELKKEDKNATATLTEPNIKVTYKGYETTIDISNGSMTDLAKKGSDSNSGSDEINWEEKNEQQQNILTKNLLMT